MQERLLIIDDQIAVHRDFQKILSPRTPLTDDRLRAIDAMHRDLFEVEEIDEEVLDFRVDSAFDGRSGVRMAQEAIQAGDPYVLFFVDVDLGTGEHGLWTVGRLREVQPEAEIVLISGYGDRTEQLIRTQITQYPDILFLAKPFDVIAIRQLALSLTHRRRRLDGMREKIEYLENKTTTTSADISDTAFVAFLTHEIRTLLQGVLGSAELLADADDEARRHQLVETLKHNGDILMKLVDNVLDLTKVASGKVTLVREPFSLRQTLNAITDAFATQLAQQGDVLHLNIGDDVPERLLGDGKRLSGVLVNLLSNAVKVTNQGHIYLETHLQSQDGDQVELLFRVRDTGVGIPEDQLKRLFGYFEQVTHPSGPIPGFGLGLMLVQKLTHLMGGEVRIQSELGEGATLEFVLTFGIDQTLEQDSTSPDLSVPSIEGRPAHVLVVEDFPVNRQVMEAHLASGGYEVTAVGLGTEALALLAQTTFDLILLDLQMPIMDGFEVARRIRKDLGLNTPIVAVTAAAFGDQQRLAFQAGMNHFMTKPIRKASFLTRISAILKGELIGENHKDVEVFENMPIDVNKAVSDFDDDHELVREVAMKLLESTESNLVRIRDYLVEGDLALAADLAHAIHGGAANLYAIPLSNAASELEDACVHEDANKAYSACDAAQDALAKLHDHLKSIWGGL